MTLELIDIFNGIFGLLAIIAGIFIAIKLGSEYFKTKEKIFLLMGLVAIILTELWWTHGISLIYALITGKEEGIIPEIYFLIGNLFIPLGVLFWLWAFSELTSRKRQKLILIFGVIYLVVYEIFFFSILLTDPSLIGELQGPIHVKYNYGLVFLFLPAVIFVFFTCLVFYLESIKSDKPEVILRGKLILIGIIIFYIGALIEAFLSLTIAFLLFARTLLIISGILFYIGFFAPEIEGKREELRSVPIETLFRTKPSQITEEDVSIYREQLICLVCKGKVSRLNYICPKCTALYCAKCSDILSNLENECWVCETPFDESKPIKPYKIDESKIEPEIIVINNK